MFLSRFPSAIGGRGLLSSHAVYSAALRWKDAPVYQTPVSDAAIGLPALLWLWFWYGYGFGTGLVQCRLDVVLLLLLPGAGEGTKTGRVFTNGFRLFRFIAVKKKERRKKRRSSNAC